MFWLKMISYHRAIIFSWNM